MDFGSVPSEEKSNDSVQFRLSLFVRYSDLILSWYIHMPQDQKKPKITDPTKLFSPYILQHAKSEIKERKKCL